MGNCSMSDPCFVEYGVLLRDSETLTIFVELHGNMEICEFARCEMADLVIHGELRVWAVYVAEMPRTHDDIGPSLEMENWRKDYDE